MSKVEGKRKELPNKAEVRQGFSGSVRRKVNLNLSSSLGSDMTPHQGASIT